MPSRERAASAFARVDAELAAWACGAGLNISPARVRAWRIDGLLPAPSATGARPARSPHGKHALVYTELELATAREVIAFLATHARRGRPKSDLALLLFANNLPVPHDRVVTGLRIQIMRIRREIRAAVELARSETSEVASEWALTAAYEHAEAMADRAISRKSKTARAIRRQLSHAGQPSTTADVHAVLTALFRTALGEPPDVDDAEGLAQILFAFGAHGLVEKPDFADTAIVPEGPTGYGKLLNLAATGVLTVADDITDDELAGARELAQTLSMVYAAIPSPQVLHYLGGDATLSFWQPDHPQKVAQLLNYFVNVRRETGLDPTPIVNALRQLGWLPD